MCCLCVCQLAEEQQRKEATLAATRDASDSLAAVVASQQELVPALRRDIEAAEVALRKSLTTEGNLEVRVSAHSRSLWVLDVLTRCGAGLV